MKSARTCDCSACQLGHEPITFALPCFEIDSLLSGLSEVVAWKRSVTL